MFWIVHLFALLLFWPALFVTVPLHLIAGRMAPKPAPVQGPPPLPGQRPSGGVPGWITLVVVGSAFATVFWLASSPSAPPLGSTPARSTPRPAPASQPGVERFKVASDANAVYQLITVEGPQTARKIVTLREGSSGKMYTTRIYNCQTRKVRQLGASESIDRMRAYNGPSPWTDIVPGSIADGVGGVACKPR